MKITRLLLALLLAVPLYAQTISGSITTSSSDCSIGAACISLPLPTNAAAATLQVAGTYTGTLQFELTSDAKGCLAASTSFVNISASPLPTGAAVSSTTSTGTWRTNSAGGTCLRIRASAFASGSATVTLNYGTGSASSGAGGGSALGFDTLASGTNTSAAMVVGTGASLAASGSGTIAATSLAGFTGTLNQVPKGNGAGGLSDSIGVSESYPTFTVNESQTTNGTQSVIGDIKTTQLTAPTVLACVQGAATGGFLLHNQSYFYKVTAISANGETTVSNESTFTTAASPVPDTYTASCTWTGHTGDTGYKLYRSTTTGNELLLATITPGNVNSYTDNTNVVPAGAMPTVNSTGTLTAAGQIIGNGSQLAASPSIAIGPVGSGLFNDGFGNVAFAVAGAATGIVVFGGGINATNTGSIEAANFFNPTTNIAVKIQGGSDATTTGASGTLTARGEDVTGGSTTSLAGGAITVRGGDNASTGNTNAGGAATIRGGDATGGTGTSDTGGTITVRGGNCTSTTGSCVPGSTTVQGGGFSAAFTNGAASDTLIAAGQGTGNGAPAHVKIQAPALGLASASTAQPLITQFTTHKKAGSTTSATPTTLFNIASATNSAWGLEILVHVDLISSTPNVCSTTERFSLSGTNNNGAFGTVNIVAGTISTLCSTGTLTLAISATAANPSVISVTPTWVTIASISSATITVQIQNVSQQEIALL